MKIKDWPKTNCLYQREMCENRYLVKDEVFDRMEWVFDEGVRATDKLHGTNVCFVVEDGEVVLISNRTQIITKSPRIHTNLGQKETMFLKAYLNSAEKGWLGDLGDGYHYGELVGPKVNGNLHNLTCHYFVPFSILKQKFHWKSWISNKYPKDFAAISSWFKDLPSLFTKKYGTNPGLAEGIVFWHPDGRVAKLRRDMFEWYYES